MNKQPRDYDQELAQLLDITRQHCKGLLFPIAQPIQDDAIVTPMLTWVVEGSGEKRSAKNANS